jgi:hypothetical protein
MPSPLQTRANNQKVQIRTTAAVGMEWTEEWRPLEDNVAGVRSFLAKVDRWQRSGEQLYVRPYFHSQTSQGTLAVDATGAVNGASQTGSSLVSDGWTASGTLKEGDYITIASFPYAMMVTADAAADGSGNMTIPIDPPMFVGTSPGDGNTITVNGVLTCYIVDEVNYPAAFQLDVYTGLRITFREVVE